MWAAAVMLAAAEPNSPLTVAYTIDPKHQLIEGLASDEQTLFVSSVLDRTIIGCVVSCRDLFTLKGQAVPLGMAWDSRRSLLWIAMHCPSLPGVSRCSGEVRAVTPNGRVKFRLWPGGRFEPGDISVDRKFVIVSDSGSGQIYRLDPERRRWTKLVAQGDKQSAQGTAVLENGNILAADYSKGLSRIDPKTGSREMILLDDGTPLRGIDGMLPDRIFAYGVYNGTVPGKLLRLDVYGNVVRPWEFGKLPDPTQITKRGLDLFAISDSGWALIDQKLPRTKGAEIVRFPAAIWD